MSRYLRVIATTLVLGTSASLAFAQTQPSRQLLTFTISPKEVRISLPVGRRDLWLWRVPETPDNQREYAWEVVLDSAESRGFGFYLFKFPGAPPGSGSLHDLLRNGQRNVWERTSAHMERMVSKARIAVGPADSGVTITITDPWTIDFLFRNHPSIGTLRLQNPGRELTKIPVRFEYPPD